ncbi:MAG: hypothetical protein JOZ13_16130 [Alphaproteobacteria bacterium]|nr:hypothetical protein [Alphaproteobacteria bacterium]
MSEFSCCLSHCIGPWECACAAGERGVQPLEALRCECLHNRMHEVSQATRARLAEVVSELRRECLEAPVLEDTVHRLEILAEVAP